MHWILYLQIQYLETTSLQHMVAFLPQVLQGSQEYE